MPGEDIQLILMTVGATVGVISLFLLIRNRIIDNKIKVTVTHTTRAMLVGPSMDYAGIVIEVFLLNSGNKTLHLKRPYLRLPFKKDGFDQFDMINMRDNTTYPIKLEPGQEYSVQMGLENFLESFSYLKPYRRVRFEVRSTMGRIFKSKKVWFRSFLKQGELHETLLSKNA